MTLSPYRGLSIPELCWFTGAVITIALAITLYQRELFDDEIFTILTVEDFDARTIAVQYSMGRDIHPPGSYLFFEFISQVSGSEHFLRFAALLCSTIAFALILDLTFRAVEARGTRRILLALPFLFFPLLYGAGDALRSYPPFALTTAIFAWSYVRYRKPTVVAAIGLGLSASISAFAIVPYLAFLIHRYALRKSFDWVRDTAFHAGVFLLALPGLYNSLVVANRISAGADNDPLVATGKFVLGFLGGNRLGPGYYWLVIPYAGFILYLLIKGFTTLRRVPVQSDRDQRYLTEYSLLLIVLSLLVPIVFGFDRPRSFLFVAPFVAGLISIQLSYSSKTTIILFGILTLCVFLVFVLNLHTSVRPYKRNLATPTAEITRFVLDHVGDQDKALVISANPVVLYRLRAYVTCVYGVDFWDTCAPRPGSGQHDEVILIKSDNFEADPRLSKLGAETMLKRSLVAKAKFGRDQDTALKNKLTGATLNEWLAQVEVYR